MSLPSVHRRLASRRVRPEWLDALPPSDPEALASRRDLRRLNALMGHAAIVDRELREVWASSNPQRVLELGAGDGSWALNLVRRRPAFWKGAQFDLLDRQPQVTAKTLEEFERLGVRARVKEMDIEDWRVGPSDETDLIVANLFLHHFDSRALGPTLASIASRCRAFICCEPRRSAVAWIAARCCFVIGCNCVTRHDAVISVEAGFREGELTACWPRSETWRAREVPSGWFSHLMSAWNIQSHPLGNP